MGKFLDPEGTVYTPKGQFLDDPSIPVLEESDTPYIQVSTPEQRASWDRKGKIGAFEALNRQGVYDILPFSPSPFMKTGKVLNAVNRLKKDEYDGDSIGKTNDEEIVRNFLLKQEEVDYRGHSWMGEVALGVSQLPGFMVEFAASGGVGAILKRGAVSVAKKAGMAGTMAAAKRFAKSGAIGASAAAVGKVATEAAVRSPIMVNRYTAKYNEKQIFANLAFTDKGVEIAEASKEKPHISFVNAYADTFIEVGSETVGSAIFKPAGKVVGGAVSKRVPKELAKKMDKFFKMLDPEGKISAGMSKAGFDGVIEEMGEEEVGRMLRAAFDVEDIGEDNDTIMDRYLETTPSLYDLSVQAGIFSIPGAGSFTAQTLYNKMRKRGASEEDIDNVAENLSEKEKEILLADIYEVQGEQAAKAIKKVLGNQDLNAEESAALEETFQEFIESGKIEIQVEEGEEYKEPNLKTKAQAVETAMNIELEEQQIAQEEAQEFAEEFKMLREAQAEIQAEKEKQDQELPDELLNDVELAEKRRKDIAKEVSDLNAQIGTQDVATEEQSKKLNKLNRSLFFLEEYINKQNQDYVPAEKKPTPGEDPNATRTQKQKSILKERLRVFKAGVKDGRRFEANQIKKILQDVKKLLKRTKLDPADKIKMYEKINQFTTKNFNRKKEQLVELVDRLSNVRIIEKQPKNTRQSVDVRYQKQIDEIISSLGRTKTERRKTAVNMEAQELAQMARNVQELRDQGKKAFRDKKDQRDKAKMIIEYALIKYAGGKRPPGKSDRNKDIKKGMNKKRDTMFIRPLRYLRMMGGKLFEDFFYNSIDAAHTQKAAEMLVRKGKILEIRKNNKMKNSDLAKQFRTADGELYLLNEIMRMWVARNDLDALKAIKGSERTLTDADMQDLFNLVKQRGYGRYLKAADHIQEVVAEKFEDINNMTEAVYNKTLKKVDKYFPIVYETKTYTENAYNEMIDPLMYENFARTGKGFKYTSVNKSFTINRTGFENIHHNKVSLDFMGDANRAITSQEHMLAYAPLQKAFNSILANKDFKEAVEFNHGTWAFKWLNKYLDEVINPNLMYRGLGKTGIFLRRLRKNIGTAFLGINVVTAMKQFPSIMLALRYAPPDYVFSSFFTMLTSKKAREKVKKMDVSLADRMLSRDLDEILREPGKFVNMENEKMSDLINASRIAYKGIQKHAFSMIMGVDSVVVASVYDAAYRYARRTKSEAEARDIAHKAVIETQPQSAVKDLPEMYRTSDEFIRMALLFSNQLNQIYNLTLESLGDLKSGDRIKAMNTLTGIMLSSMLIYFISTGGNPPDDEEEFVDFILGSMISGIPFVGGIVSSSLRGFDAAASPAEQIFETGSGVVNAVLKGDGEKTLTESAELIALLTGIPMAQPRRTLKGAYRLMHEGADDYRELIWSKYSLE